MYSFSYLEPVCCSMSSSNCCFLYCYRFLRRHGGCSGIPISKNISQFVVIYTVKGFSIVSEAEVDVLFEFFYDPMDVGNLISGPSAFSKSSLNTWKFLVHILLKPCLENFEVYLVNKLKLYLQNKQKARIGLRAVFYSLLISMSLFKIHHAWK